MAILLAGSVSAVGQSSDNQWFVWNNLGKVGINQFDKNDFPTGNTLSNSIFSIDSVFHANRSISTLAKNDLFVIYNNWKHLNTREKGVMSYNPAIDIFYPYQGVSGRSLTDVFHNFTVPSGSLINYFYLSNLYEGDDPPKRVRVSNTPGGSNSNAYSLSTTTPSTILTANHNVAVKKDITLILDKKSFTPTGNEYLDIKVVTPSGQVFRKNFFTPSPVFRIQNGDYFSNMSTLLTSISTSGSHRIPLPTLNSVIDPYVYFNLRPTAEIDSFLPDKQYPNSRAVFELKGTNGGETTTLATLTEMILYAHDPNSIQVEKICRDAKGGVAVNYYLQFQNTGNMAPNAVSVQFDIPNGMNHRCVAFSKLYAAGQEIQGNVQVSCNEKSIQIDFPQSSIGICTDQDFMSCIGGVRFCVILEPGFKVEDCTNSLELINPVVYFDGVPFPIKEFFDKTEDADPCKRVVEEEVCQCKCLLWKCIIPPALAALIAIGILIAIGLRMRGKSIIKSKE